jgi:AraC-like DNA-binding protein
MGDPVIGRALRLLHEHPAHPWTVASLAAKAGISRAALARSFTELVGVPPMTYLREWRLTLAADLLRDPATTLDAVARQVGYGNGFALSTAFKRLRGPEPTGASHRQPQPSAGHRPAGGLSRPTRPPNGRWDVRCSAWRASRLVAVAGAGGRAALLGRLVDHLAEAGAHDLTLRGLAAAVGTSHRMLIHHFGTIDGLVTAVVTEVEERQRTALADLAPTPKPRSLSSPRLSGARSAHRSSGSSNASSSSCTDACSSGRDGTPTGCS